MSNMAIYEKARSVPDEAKKKITGGRLNGMTDINPMYRIKRMTEIFGPCGIGWWYNITNKQIIDDAATGQRAAFVDIELFYVHPETGKISNAIPGTGGAAFLAKESKGLYLSDECFKMALTDALSVACKALGIAANVYWDKDRTKYTTNNTSPDKNGDQAQNEITADNVGNNVTICEKCGKPIKGFKQGNSVYKSTDVMAWSRDKFGKNLCYRCYVAQCNELQRHANEAEMESLHGDYGDRD